MMNSSSGGNLSKEFFDLVKSIGESRSKQEEDRIIVNEVQTLKKNINVPNVTSRRMKEYLVRAIYVEMLGHDASFAHIHAVNLAQEKDLLCKRMGYLACTLCLHKDHELMLLLINTVQRDFSSPNFLEVSAALSCVCRLLNSEMLPAIHPLISRLQSHSHESIRKKACIALYKLYQMQPDEMLNEAVEFTKRALCDSDASVRGASLHLLEELVKRDWKLCKPLAPALVSMLKQIIDHRLPREYDYHRAPAPWLQVKLLSILAALGACDQLVSEQIYEVVHSTMKAAESLGANVGFAILYECVRTITTIYPQHTLLESAAASISRFITAENHNLQFVGLTGLAAIVKVNPSLAAQHQLIVVECLEDPDETLKRKTLDLLCTMTNPKNVKVIVEKFLFHLKSSSDYHLRCELAAKLIHLSERFAPDNKWYLDTMSIVLERAGTLVPHHTAHNLIHIIAEGPLGEEEQDTEFRRYAVNSYLQLCERLMPHIPEILCQVVAWTLGEFGELSTIEGYSIDDICFLLSDLADRNFRNVESKVWVIDAIMKLHARFPKQTKTVGEFLLKHASSRSCDVQQKCYEFLALIEDNTDSKLLQNIFPSNSYCEAIPTEDDLDFIEDFVDEALANGAEPYLAPKDRPPNFVGSLKVAESDSSATKTLTLKFEPYEIPVRAYRPIPTNLGARNVIKCQEPVSNDEATGDAVKSGTTDIQRAKNEKSKMSDVSGASVGKTQEDPSTKVKRQKGFQVQGPRRWGPEGYQRQTVPQRVLKQTTFEAETNRVYNSGMSSADVPPKSYGEVSNSVFGETAPTASNKIYSSAAELSEKEKIAAALFSGLGGVSKPSSSATDLHDSPSLSHQQTKNNATAATGVRRFQRSAKVSAKQQPVNSGSATSLVSLMPDSIPWGGKSITSTAGSKREAKDNKRADLHHSDLDVLGKVTERESFDLLNLGPLSADEKLTTTIPKKKSTTKYDGLDIIDLQFTSTTKNVSAPKAVFSGDVVGVINPSNNLSAAELTTEQVATLWPQLKVQQSFTVSCRLTCESFFSRVKAKIPIHVVQIIGTEGIAACIRNDTASTSPHLAISGGGTSTNVPPYVFFHVRSVSHGGIATSAAVTVKTTEQEFGKAMEEAIRNAVSA